VKGVTRLKSGGRARVERSNRGGSRSRSQWCKNKEKRGWKGKKQKIAEVRLVAGHENNN